MKLLTSTLLILAAPLSYAEWTLSPDSSVKFLSTKNTNITEVHEFTQVSGSVSDKGNAEIAIDLTSVETGIGIRNERMQSMLFNVSDYATATVSADLPETMMLALKNGETATSLLPLTLELHGEKKDIEADVLATAAADGHVIVTTQSPVLVNAGEFKLAKGVEALREVAGLDRISTTVPVTFTLLFTEAPE
ncbi:MULTISPECIES: YceI family protein [Thalassolituus]|uniref:YceI family protein n=1 Tax=Thalassolituus TaxID=187492 RepID=UPI000C5B2C4C|nr:MULTISPECIES: YceI family protein [Thalassolituus]MAX87231.1 polyisoprenoid-binding protein [Oceanospirillaceae bacterium]MEE3208911.1 YceI family protein [Pseudomonadota bacterium]|tara:strand:- start:612 stop:1187 length:576 start_codon:yes stop_codon:yes gene_type:complete